jgi:transcriptional regulator with XRE-family HTH domain
MTPKQLFDWRKRRRLTQAQAAVVLGLSHRMYRYYEKGAREDGRSVAIPKTVELATRHIDAGKEPSAATVIEKATLEGLLAALGETLAEPTTLCIVGSAAAILLGQPERQTPDIDIWGPESDFDIGALRRACAQAGLLYDPRGEVDPGAVYLQILRPGITMFPEHFAAERIGRFGKLTLVMPPPVLIVATKLARGLESDIEDAAWWMRERDLSIAAVEAAIALIPQADNREAARENLILIHLVAKGHGR